tara:strand:+ start:3130 stop:3264 length:135 start_codon:yes stop_codon:yes gene_type:complete
MGKRLIEGREKSKGKKYSHRPQRATNTYYDEKAKKHYRKADVEK